jgi:hypothetical protein
MEIPDRPQWVSTEGVLESCAFPGLHWFERGSAKPPDIAVPLARAITDAIRQSRDRLIAQDRAVLEEERHSWLPSDMATSVRNAKLAQSMAVCSEQVKEAWPTMLAVPPVFSRLLRDEIVHLSGKAAFLDVLELQCQ